jgi:putative endonuclease
MVHNYQILARNYRHGRAELDIIAHEGGCLVGIEVKTRSSVGFGMPETFVTEAKLERYATGLAHYANEQNWEGGTRVDIVALVLVEDGWEAMLFVGV